MIINGTQTHAGIAFYVAVFVSCETNKPSKDER